MVKSAIMALHGRGKQAARPCSALAALLVSSSVGRRHYMLRNKVTYNLAGILFVSIFDLLLVAYIIAYERPISYTSLVAWGTASLFGLVRSFTGPVPFWKVLIAFVSGCLIGTAIPIEKIHAPWDAQIVVRGTFIVPGLLTAFVAFKRRRALKNVE